MNHSGHAKLVAPLLLLFIATTSLTFGNMTSATSVTSSVASDVAAKANEKKDSKTTKKKSQKKSEKKTEKKAPKKTKKQIEAEKAKKKKARAERKARLNPQISPPPTWPPKGFERNNGVYAKIPTKSELKGLTSASTPLFNKVLACQEVACRPLIVASEAKCLWWEVLSTVTGPKTSDSATITSYGSLTTVTKGSEARERKVIMLMSNEPLIPGVEVENINIRCHRSGEKGKSGNVYLPFPDRD